MNKRVSPTLIGVFVVGALTLVVIAVLMFGSGRYFRKTYEFVLYFDSSVNGLRVGAPVKIRGVEIGAVKNILLRLEEDMKVQRIPVVIEIDLEKLTTRGVTGGALTEPAAFQQAIKQGLRGQLQLESFVTGLLFIGLDFFPDSPPNFVQEPGNQQYRYQEIPTQPTALEKVQGAASQILARLEEIDFKALIEATEQTVAGVNQLVNSPDLKRAVQSLDEVTATVREAAGDIARLATTVDGNFKSLSADIQATTAEARTALKQAGGAIEQTQAAIKEAETTMADMRAVIDPDSPILYEITRSLKEVTTASRSLRLLADYLERNPRALIFGRPGTKEE
jgi:paraquat-inducible protein B